MTQEIIEEKKKTCARRKDGWKENERRVGRNRSDIIGRTRGDDVISDDSLSRPWLVVAGGEEGERDTRGRRWKHELPKKHGWRESVHCYRRGHDNKFTACGDRVRVFIKS